MSARDSRDIKRASHVTYHPTENPRQCCRDVSRIWNQVASSSWRGPTRNWQSIIHDLDEQQGSDPANR